MAHLKSKIYYAVAYLRLSREDGDKERATVSQNRKN